MGIEGMMITYRQYQTTIFASSGVFCGERNLERTLRTIGGLFVLFVRSYVESYNTQIYKVFSINEYVSAAAFCLLGFYFVYELTKDTNNGVPDLSLPKSGIS